MNDIPFDPYDCLFDRDLPSCGFAGQVGDVHQSAAAGHFHHQHAEFFDLCFIDHGAEFFHIDLFALVQLGAGDGEAFSLQVLLVEVAHGESDAVGGQHHLGVLKIRGHGIDKMHLHRPLAELRRDGVPRDHLSGKYSEINNSRSKPFGEEMVAGYLKLENGNSVYFDYNKGAISLNNLEMPPMPLEIIEKSPMSWWNFALEVHTGRIFKPLIGDFYILIIPLFGIFGTLLVISGIIVWIKLYARKNRKIPFPTA